MSQSPFSLLDITTTDSGFFLSVGLSPTRTAASFAAPDPYGQDCCIRLLPQIPGVEAHGRTRVQNHSTRDPSSDKRTETFPGYPTLLAPPL